ncbi:hypothetical protein [[Mycobacterium] burgundiense]|uniref:Uncharacterized protein n=1 Tax=[Mycobacterium] burgundiense TaxID=3064286 RepID=A0ABM9M7I4_9MYCO|nr:hypothetical protein [Mycolicibacterium sp. MU0053]CAJ1511188.1 hypothetical protein MU0053_005105 [Mycolicibacterium sp. MU0053]
MAMTFITNDWVHEVSAAANADDKFRAAPSRSPKETAAAKPPP